MGISLVVHWLRLGTTNAEGLGLISGQGTRSCMSQLNIPQVVSESLRPHGLQPSRLFCPWNFPDKNTGNRLPFLPPGDPRNSGIEPASLTSPVLAGDGTTWEAPKILHVVTKDSCNQKSHVPQQRSLVPQLRFGTAISINI